MRLQAHVEGQIQMTPTQIKAAEILLRKTMPDLQSVSLTGADGHGAVQFSWMQPAAIENNPSPDLITDAVLLENKA